MSSEEQPVTECPHCGQSIGSQGSSSDGGTAIESRPGGRALRYVSLGLAVIGAALLLLVAVQSLTPTLEPGSVMEPGVTAGDRVGEEEGRQPATRGAESTPTREPVLSPPATVAAMPGSMARETATEETVATERASKVAEATRPAATRGPERATPTDSTLRLADLTVADAGRLVEVHGVLAAIQSFSAGVKGSLDDGTAAITVVLWQDTYDRLVEPAAIVPGAILSITGKVQEYLGELEIIPLSAADVTVTGQQPVALDERELHQIAAVDVGQRVQVSGQIVGADPFSQGIKYTLDDGTATCTLLLWENVLERIQGGDALRVGASVVVRGEIAEYLGALEIVPPIPYDVEILATAEPGPASQLEGRTIGSITSEEAGSSLTLEQVGIADIIYFSKGIKLTLVDESGSMVLLLWQNVLEETPERYNLRAGNKIQVSGVIDAYQGELQIVPRRGAEVVVLGAAGPVSIPERATGDISAMDEGQIVTVMGRLLDLVGDTWQKFWLDDGTGQVLVFLPQRVAEYIPADLQAGQQLRVTGEVDIYDGEVEIIPLAGCDVERP